MSFEPPRRQMARRIDDQRPRAGSLGIVVVGLIIVVGLVGALVMLAGQSRPSAGSTQSPAVSAPASVSATPTRRPASEAPEPAPSATQHPPTSSPPIITPPTTPPSPSPTVPASAAPTSAADFDLNGQVIDIGFPLRADSKYHYRDNWLEPRAGPPNAYNHAKVNAKGELVRLHDGIDIYAPEGVPVLAPFDGTIIDPATRWSPWEPDRYGLTVVVESDEPGTAGYLAVLVHLDADWVEIGQHVTRGQVVGVLGKTGNAEEVRPQLHFELRAPFLIDWSAIGEDRQVDAFNPYQSLVAVDPHDQ